MQCNRLLQLIKSWYVHVREETMAPARMVGFIEEHAKSCETCLQDAELPGEISKITELILPESKIPKAVRQQNNKLKEAEAAAAEEADRNESESEEDAVEVDQDEEEDEEALDVDDVEKKPETT